MTVLRLAIAFLARDIRIALSYRVGFVLTLLSAGAGVVAIYFLSRAVGGNVSALAEYGGSYFDYAVIGLVVTNFMAAGTASGSQKVREAQLTGTLEMMIVSPNRPAVILLGSALWNHAFALVSTTTMLVVAAALGMDFSQVNVPAAALAFLTAVISFNALGLVSAAVVLAIKQGDPVTWIISGASALLAGVLYPTTVLPDQLRALAQLLPLTHALELIRRSVSTGASLTELAGPFTALLILAVSLAVLGTLALSAALEIARRDGTLSQY